jgi:hypothetical protein
MRTGVLIDTYLAPVLPLLHLPSNSSRYKEDKRLLGRFAASHPLPLV